MIPISRIVKDYNDAGSVSGLIALWGFVGDGIFLTKAGALGVAFRVYPADSECLDIAAREAASARIAQVLRRLPEDYRLYGYMLKRPAVVAPPPINPNPVLNAALQERARFIATSPPFFSCEHYLVLVNHSFARRHHALRFSPWSGFSHTALRNQIGRRMDTSAAEVRHQADAVAISLEDVLHPAPLSNRDIFRFVRRLCNYVAWKADAGALPSDAWLDYFVADSSIECHRGHLQMDDYRIKVLTMKEPPGATYAQMLEALHTVPQAMVVCAEWQRLSSHRVRRDINARRRHYFNKRISLVNYLSPDTRPDQMLVDESASAIVAQLNESLSAIDVHGRVFGASSLTVVLYDTDPARLDRGVAETAKAFARHDGILAVETYNALNAWLAVLPGNTDHNLRRLTLLDVNHADLLPFVGIATGGVPQGAGDPPEPLATFRSRQHTPYDWRLPYQDVGHTLVLGATGAGKSFLLNFLVTHAQKFDPLTVIFDIGGGYAKLTSLLGGSSWRIGIGGGAVKINPFALPYSAENIHFLAALTRVLAQAGAQYQLTLQDDRDLYEAVDSLYTLDPPHRRLFTLANMLPRSLSNALARWIQGGPYAAVFDNEEDTISFQRLQAFDFTGLDAFPLVLEPLLFYVLHCAAAAVEAAPIGQLKLFVLDEAWRFIKDRTVKAYVAEALKTWRKRNAAVLLATQSSDDFADPDILRTVVESCPTKCFLASPDLEVSRAAELFHLNEVEVRRIRELQPRREFLLKRPDASKVLELAVDARAYWIYTNTPLDNVLVEQARLTGTLDEAVTRLAGAIH